MDLIEKGMGQLLRDARPSNPLQPSKSISALVEWRKRHDGRMGERTENMEQGTRDKEHGNMGAREHSDRD